MIRREHAELPAAGQVEGNMFGAVDAKLDGLDADWSGGGWRVWHSTKRGLDL